jgi:NAD(P)-dependent dehydrogenase (short-subunit alcohol dehydrogenase family)
MDLDLGGKTALVTGGSKGIGLACARAFAAEGCHLHLAARTEADLTRAKAEIEGSHNVTVTIHPVDLSDGDAARALAAACAGIDVLVNNAGAIPGGDIREVEEERWRTAWDLKVFGYINLTRAVYADMKARGRGVIVNVIGLAGERPRANYVAGATGNAGLMAFTKALGGRAPDDGLRVVACNPGQVVTDRLTNLLKTQAREKFGDEGRWEELMNKNPPPGRPEEIADLVVYLASPRASHITGTTITIDGGASSR